MPGLLPYPRTQGRNVKIDLLILLSVYIPLLAVYVYHGREDRGTRGVACILLALVLFFWFLCVPRVNFDLTYRRPDSLWLDVLHSVSFYLFSCCVSVFFMLLHDRFIKKLPTSPFVNFLPPFVKYSYGTLGVILSLSARSVPDFGIRVIPDILVVLGVLVAVVHCFVSVILTVGVDSK